MAVAKLKPVNDAKNTLLKCIAEQHAEARAGKHYDFPVIKESIEAIEIVVSRENIPRKAAYMIGNALKYILRAGVKTESWSEDISKAENYLHRALSGEWIEKK